MNEQITDLTALLGSRICHDLISPIGAIGNGLELMALAGNGPGPEFDLIHESVTNAQARIRYYRVAYGTSSNGQNLSTPEIVDILNGISQGGRLSISWDTVGEVPRAECKLVFLLLQCMETAMPYGGAISVDRADSRWSLTGQGPKIKHEPNLWAMLSNRDTETPVITPALIQFALAPQQARDMGRNLDCNVSDAHVQISF